MRATLILFFIVISGNVINAQCNISTRDIDDWIAIDAGTESLYTNEDLENGIFSISGSISLFFNKVDKSVQFMIIVSMASSGSKKEIPPRQLSISLSNGELISLTAESLSDPQYAGNAKQVIGSFTLPNKDYLQMKDNNVTSLTISDNRTGQSYSFSPYAGIFKEQIDCIVKRTQKK